MKIPFVPLSLFSLTMMLSLWSMGVLVPAMAQPADTGTIAAIAAMPIGNVVPWLTCAIAIATALLLVLPAPTEASGPAYAGVYNLVHIIANLKTAPGTATRTPAPPPAAAVAMLLLVGAVTLSACSPAQQAQSQQVIAIACDVDGAIQPAAVSLAPLAGAGGVAVASVDAALVHPAVIAACKAFNGRPVSAVISPTAPAVATAPAAPVLPAAPPTVVAPQ